MTKLEKKTNSEACSYCFYQCECGKNYIVYVPARVMFKKVFDTTGLVKQLKELGVKREMQKSTAKDLEKNLKRVELWDEEQRKKGEIERIRRAAELLRAEFRDIRENEIIQCRCGRTFDTLMQLSQATRKTSGAFFFRGNKKFT